MDGQHHIGHQLPNVISVLQMGPLVGDGVTLLHLRKAYRQVDPGVQKTHYAGRRDGVHLIDFIGQPHGKLQPPPKQEVRAKAPQNQRSGPHCPKHSECRAPGLFRRLGRGDVPGFCLIIIGSYLLPFRGHDRLHRRTGSQSPVILRRPLNCSLVVAGVAALEVDPGRLGRCVHHTEAGAESHRTQQPQGGYGPEHQGHTLGRPEVVQRPAHCQSRQPHQSPVKAHAQNCIQNSRHISSLPSCFRLSDVGWRPPPAWTGGDSA